MGNRKSHSNDWKGIRQKVIDKIKSEILLNGMSPSQIAKPLNKSPSTINRMYRENHLTPRMANVLSEFFGYCNFEDLLNGKKYSRKMEMKEPEKQQTHMNSSITMILLKDIQGKVKQLKQEGELNGFWVEDSKGLYTFF